MIAVNGRIEKLDRRTKNGATGRSDIEGKAVRVTASDSGSERVSIKSLLSIASASLAWPQTSTLLVSKLVHVITRKRLNEFAEKRPDARSSLAHWYAIMRNSRFLNFVQLRETFPHADQVGKFTVFNIGGNKVRLIAAVHYNRSKIYIRHVLTHQEYDTGKWKK
jgi:mRNA interferase HigB